MTQPAMRSAAEQPINDAFEACVTALSAGDHAGADDLATAVEATANGHAMVLLDGDFGQGSAAADEAADRAARATLALIRGHQELRQVPTQHRTSRDGSDLAKALSG